ncbi:MAG: SRPBCC family protein [Pseudomonadota bacterium]
MDMPVAIGSSGLALVLAVALVLTATGAHASADETTPWPTPPRSVAPGPEDWSRLQSGEIIVTDTRLDEQGGSALALAVYHVDRETLWRTIGDCNANTRFVRGLKFCEVVSESPTRAMTRQQLKAYQLLPTLDYTFETVREPFEWIRIRLIEGELEALEGSWRFQPLPDGDGVLVAHQVRVHPKLPVPRWLARRTVHRDLANLMACLRWEVKGWSDPRQRGKDREACP